MEKNASERAYLGIRRSLRLLAMVACLWPAVGAAQPPNPTGSDANHNTAAGANALLSVTGSGFFNTAIGDSALKSTTSGSANTAAGSSALFSNTTGFGNAALGDSALQSNTTGVRNSASGSNALDANTTGTDNTATGAYALSSNTTGGFNTASGSNVLFENTTGSYNTANGYFALFSNTIGKQNTAIGVNTLHANTTGNNNTAVGYYALTGLSGSANLSSNNIALGYKAGAAIQSGSNNIDIGHIGGSGDNKVTRIGTAQTKVFIAGIKGVPLSGATVVVNGAGQLGVVASSARYKTDIRALSSNVNRLDRLRPVSYRYKTEPDATHYGLIAEEVDKVMPELVVRDEQGRPESVQYLELIPLLLQERQELRAELARQHAVAEQQQARLERQESELAELRRTLHARLASIDH